MPWHQEPKKDVVSCDKPREAASKLWSGDFRMGKPTWSNVQVSVTESRGSRRYTRGTETSKYPEEEKEKSITLVAASEMGRAQTDKVYFIGVEDIVIRRRLL